MEKKKTSGIMLGVCYILSMRMLEDLPVVLCTGFAHGFSHDGFLPIVFCRYGQGNYNYVLNQG